MDPFLALRQRAAAKRDYSISVARRIYQKDLAAIESLARALPAQVDLEPVEVPFVENTMALIQSLIPKDKPFTVADMIEWLTSAQPGQKFHEPTVRTYVSRLCSRGILKKLYKTGSKYTLWIANDAHVPIDATPLAALAADIMRDAGRPMRLAEVAIALRDKGYRADATPTTLTRAVSDLFKRSQGQFQRAKDGRWSALPN